MTIQAKPFRWERQIRDFFALLGLGAVTAYAADRALARLGRAPAEISLGDRPQISSASQAGRGRLARTPAQIPWAGWKDILVRTYREVQDDRLVTVAAGVVFYGLLALFPAVTAIVSSYALFAPASSIENHLGFLSTTLPPGAYSIIHDQIVRINEKGAVTLGLSFFVSLGLAIWSANAGLKAIIDALNIVYDEEEKRSFLSLNGTSLLLTTGAVAAALVAVAAVVALPLFLEIVGGNSWAETILTLARWPALMIGLLAALAVLYRFGPSREKPRWQWITPGALLATILWTAGSSLLSFYLSNFGNYDATYGALAELIGLLMWMWMTSVIILLGAELNAETEHQTARDSTEGPSKPLGARGSNMADSVG